MTNYKQVKALADGRAILIDFLNGGKLDSITGDEAAELLRVPPKAARSMLQTMARGGMLERVDRGQYRAPSAPTAPAAPPPVRKGPKAKTPAAPAHQARRETVLPEELVRVLMEALMQGAALHLEQDRDTFVARLGNGHITTAVNRSAPLAMMDVLGKWSREGRHA